MNTPDTGPGRLSHSRASTLAMVDAAMYGVQIYLSYYLMFVSMHFQTGLFVAIVLGAAVGHLVFSPRDPDTARSQEGHC